MDIHLTRIVLRIHRTLSQMLLHRRAYAFGIGMEQQQALRQLTIIQALSFQQIRYDLFILACRFQCRDVFTRILHALLIQSLVEGKLLYLIEKFLLESGGGHLIIRREELIQILEHTARGSRSRHELHDLLVLCQISIPCLHIRSLCLFVNNHDTLIYGSGSRNLKIGETFHEASQLLFNLFFADAFRFQLL